MLTLTGTYLQALESVHLKLVQGQLKVGGFAIEIDRRIDVVACSLQLLLLDQGRSRLDDVHGDE